MAENTNISWCDHTFNPWIGCTAVSPACRLCYARELMEIRYKRATWGPGEPRVRTAPANWRQPIKWERAAAVAGIRPFVFCASLADVYDNEVDPAWRADLFDLIRATPSLVWLLLTKRIGNVLKMTGDYMSFPNNVAIGATMANQEEYDRDSGKLAEVKDELLPLFTFGSFEPLLSAVRIDERAPDWIIVGGERGNGFTPMDQQWARDLQTDADAFGRVFHYKQDGGRNGGGSLLDGIAYPARPEVGRLAA